jgi:hypothetical protein
MHLKFIEILSHAYCWIFFFLMNIYMFLWLYIAAASIRNESNDTGAIKWIPGEHSGIQPWMYQGSTSQRHVHASKYWEKCLNLCVDHIRMLCISFLNAFEYIITWTDWLTVFMSWFFVFTFNNNIIIVISTFYYIHKCSDSIFIMI